MIRDLLDQGDSRQPAVTVAGGGPSISYGQLRSQVDALAAKLREYGLQPQDRVAIALPNSLEMVASFLAAATSGTAAPLNPAYKLEEFRFFLKDTGARALIVPSGGAEEARRAADGLAMVIEVTLEADGRVLFTPNGSSLPPSRFESSAGGDVALVLHTSGTTSQPKRVPLTHANLAASAGNVARTYQLSREDRSLCVMPLFHVHGLVASTLATLITGGTVVLVPRFNPLSFWTQVHEHGVTWYSAAPAVHGLLLARARSRERPRSASGLRFIRSCSASLSPQIMAEMEDRFGVPVLEAYGMTEAAHQMSSNPLPPAIRKAGSVGQETGVRIAILDEKGEQVSLLCRGEVAIQGSNVFGGYESNPLANAESFTGGWFRTGDEGCMDQDGYLSLVGRIKELINRGGEKISPREIDEVLLSHPSVAEAISFGVPDRVYGEEVAAAVVLRAQVSGRELIRYCQELLADFKCPKVVHVIDAMPRTATGKIQRRMVAEEIEGRNR